MGVHERQGSQEVVTELLLPSERRRRAPITVPRITPVGMPISWV